jgi:hypothetical protein
MLLLEGLYGLLLFAVPMPRPLMGLVPDLAELLSGYQASDLALGAGAALAEEVDLHLSDLS